MKTSVKEILSYCVWLCLYILCVGLGTIEEAAGIGKVLFILTGLIFFLPGVYLLRLGKREKNKSEKEKKEFNSIDKIKKI